MDQTSEAILYGPSWIPLSCWTAMNRLRPLLHRFG
ncbi:hypothetical protein Prudu_016841 [Prunus dulcis]|uniref:Uncharacterized protein n=1 Tax=Prunus dulcis TaxID=3755 RepID=A0A4Y1RN17_PRUDU|nr:hypothetical protein Prudu_016841 [Prunus dulcis]